MKVIYTDEALGDLEEILASLKPTIQQYRQRLKSAFAQENSASGDGLRVRGKLSYVEAFAAFR